MLIRENVSQGAVQKFKIAIASSENLFWILTIPILSAERGRLDYYTDYTAVLVRILIRVNV
jgi:hypothetical protein